MLLEIKHIRDFHKMEGDERRFMTYAKAMASIKAYPYPIRSAKEAAAILGVGTKIGALCGEYAKYGKIEAAGRYNTCSTTWRMSMQNRRNCQTKRATIDPPGICQDTRSRLFDSSGTVR